MTYTEIRWLLLQDVGREGESRFVLHSEHFPCVASFQKSLIMASLLSA
jgi:hypothetical protein